MSNKSEKSNNNKVLNDTLYDNILDKMLMQLDIDTRELVIKLFNTILIKKYEFFKALDNSLYKTLIVNDPFYKNFNEWRKKPVTFINKDYSTVDTKTLTLSGALDLINSYINGECQRIYYLNGNVQSLVYNKYKDNRDTIMASKILKDPNIMVTLLENGVVVQCIYSTEPTECSYLIYINKGEESGDIYCISTRKYILSDEDE